MYSRIAVLAFFVLASCATLSEEECLEGNWEEIGRADGAAGRSADFIEQHRKACDKAGVEPDLTAWLAGRAEGLKTYCTPRSAYRVGRKGLIVRPVCAAEIAPQLRDANRFGLRYYTIGREIDQLRRERRDIASELARLGPADAARRASLNAELSFLFSRISILRAEQMLYARYP